MLRRDPLLALHPSPMVLCACGGSYLGVLMEREGTESKIILMGFLGSGDF